MPDMEVGVIQSLFTTDPSGRIKAKQLGKKIDRMRIRVREKSGERDAGLDRQRSNVILCLVGLAVASKKSSDSTPIQHALEGIQRVAECLPTVYQGSEEFD